MLILIKSLLPLITSFAIGVMKSSMEMKQRQHEMLIEKLAQQERSTRRAMRVSDKKVSWTRRTLALLFSTSLVGTMVTIILAGIFNPDLIFNVPAETFKHSIFSFIGLTSPKVINGYVQLQGVTLVMPLLEVLIIITETIIGFYFGSKR